MHVDSSSKKPIYIAILLSLLVGGLGGAARSGRGTSSYRNPLGSRLIGYLGRPGPPSTSSPPSLASKPGDAPMKYSAAISWARCY
jgi:hypothetical protein